MKKLAILGTLLLGLLFSGCSQKEEVASTEVSPVIVTKPEVRTLVNEDLKNVYFYFDKYDLDDKASIIVTNNAGTVKSFGNKNAIKVEGHTDEWGSDEYNYALGLKRAEAVKTKLEYEGVTNVSTISYGESKPTCTEKTVDCWSKNRRAVSIVE